MDISAPCPLLLVYLASHVRPKHCMYTWRRMEMEAIGENVDVEAGALSSYGSMRSRIFLCAYFLNCGADTRLYLQPQHIIALLSGIFLNVALP